MAAKGVVIVVGATYRLDGAVTVKERSVAAVMSSTGTVTEVEPAGMITVVPVEVP